MKIKNRPGAVSNDYSMFYKTIRVVMEENSLPGKRALPYEVKSDLEAP